MKSYTRSSRYERRTKNKKANVVLNSLIGVVLLLIIIVSATIFFGGNDKKVSQEEEQVAGEQELKEDEEEEQVVEEEEEPVEKENESVNNTPVETEDEGEVVDGPGEVDDAEAVVTEGGSSPEVIRTMVNPAWKPVGTVQEGEHSNNYDRNGVDWNEMVEAISYATGLSPDNMTIHFLGNNGHNKSVGTVYTKNKSEIYRVYIDWVNGEGWKPSMVEELSAVPKSKKKKENED